MCKDKETRGDETRRDETRRDETRRDETRRDETRAGRRQERPIHSLVNSTQFLYLPTQLGTASSLYVYPSFAYKR